MDKLATKNLGGFPFVLDDIRQFLGRLTSPANHGIYQAFNNLLRGFGDNFIVQGVVASGTTPNVAITEGWVLLDGELIKVDAQTGINTTTDNKFVKETTFDPRGNKNFLNGSIADTYEKNRAVIQGTAGNLDFDGNTFFNLSNQAIFESGIVILQKKIIEIGSWNMDALDTVDVAHGLSDITKIRNATVMIFNDGITGTQPINSINALGVINGGSIEVVNVTNVRLRRVSGGLFDNIIYDDGSINRGHITIEFEK